MALKDGPGGNLPFLLGGILAIVFGIFLIAGDLGSKKVHGDADMAPISSPEKNFR